MCRGQKGCDCPEHKDPKECTPEQIAKCHPEGGHPCEEKAKEEQSETAR